MAIHSLIERALSTLLGPSHSKDVLIANEWADRDRRCFLLLDCSTSMQGRKFQHARAGGLGFAAKALASGYAVGIIRFASDAALICSLGNDIDRIHARLATLHTSGTTNMAAAINLARMHLRADQAVRAIAVVTDGMPDNSKNTLFAAQKAKDEGIQIIAIGTNDANLPFLRALATSTDWAVKVEQEQLGRGIIAIARLLPGQSAS